MFVNLFHVDVIRGNMVQRMETLQAQLKRGKVKMQANFFKRKKRVLNSSTKVQRKRAAKRARPPTPIDDILCSQQSLGSLFAGSQQSPPSSPLHFSQLSLPFTRLTSRRSHEQVCQPKLSVCHQGFGPGQAQYVLYVAGRLQLQISRRQGH